MFKIIFIILLIFFVKSFSWNFLENPIELSKPNKDGIYEFNLIVKHSLSMTLLLKNKSTPVIDYSPDNLQWYERDPDRGTKCGLKWPLINKTNKNEEEENKLKSLIQLNGLHRLINTFNEISPGPTIVVPFGAQVLLRIKNRMHSKSFTVHVHGVDKINRWWTDGVPFIQQCPISPNTDYTYRFIADTAGTHWYHGHLMEDSGEGLVGGFVVLKPDEKMEFEVNNNNNNEKLKIGRQYLTLIQDLSTENPSKLYLDRLHWRRKWIGHSLDNKEELLNGNGCEKVERTFDGTLSREIPVSAIIIGNKGWYNQTDIINRPSKLPLTNFGIEIGENIMLRLVNAGISQGVFVWIEEHDFWIVAADGSYIKPIKVNSLLMFSGERYDIIIKGLINPKKQIYRIIFELMEQIKEIERRNLGKQKTYKEEEKENNNNDEVDWSHKYCTKERKCLIFNCPFKHFPPWINMTCIYSDKLKADNKLKNKEYLEKIKNNKTKNESKEIIIKEEEEEINEARKLALFSKIENNKQSFREIFVNLHDGLNGWRFLEPNGIPYFNKTETVKEKFCDELKCDRWTNEALYNDNCQCFINYKFKLGEIVQIIAVSAGGMPHPFHIHGHKFVILRMGFAEQYFDNGILKGLNKNLECLGKTKRCAEMKWSNKSWEEGEIPELNLNPVFRDTVIVPAKGFVVLRFRATNPGWWFAHCHLLMHSMDGMNFAFSVGNENEIPSPPKGFPHQCGIYEELPIDNNNNELLTELNKENKKVILFIRKNISLLDYILESMQ
ncbi:hypothetical protein Mgra_00005352 [Meloidogyne graminicola]|uniref:Multicopper oxidase n=1 Tax=Meloidogyne graminicola TaxID=189291 RepID=A0A8S9ZNX8_9BILA|nr:hypothetical protein Mgra_00005352 [Meloidogyne graminicola]